MYIAGIYPTFSTNHYYSTPSFKANDMEILLSLREKFNNNTITKAELDRVFDSLSEKIRDRINDIAGHFKEYNIDKYLLVKKFAFQPLLTNCNSDGTINKIKAHVFVEKNKTGRSKEELVKSVIEHKNLALSMDKIYGQLLAGKLLKKHMHDGCAYDNGNPVGALRRYYKKTPDVKFDEIIIIKDEMSEDFINFTKKLSQEWSGRDDLFRVKVSEEVTPLNKPAEITQDKEPTVRELLTNLKYNLVEKKDNWAVLMCYSKLPDRYHVSLSGFLKLIKQEKIKMDIYDVLPMYLRNGFMFNMDPQRALFTLNVKKFLNINNGNKNTDLREIIKEDFIPTGDINALYSHFLVSKMFPDNAKKPWYLRQCPSKNLTYEIMDYLQDNPNYELKFDVIDDGLISEDFCDYVKTLSRKSLKKNVFTINLV